MSKIKVKYLNQTCFAVSSQWSGCSFDGTWIYIRYRGGIFSVYYAHTLEDCIYREEFDDQYDGYLTEEEMKEHASSVLDFSEAEIRSMPNEHNTEDEESFIAWIEQRVRERSDNPPATH